MKIQCDVCEAATATIVCCADEAALCADCDVQVHAANKLASKHQRLLLQSLPSKHPRCDICQEKPAFIFCLEDRALFCRECDETIHVAGSLSGNHQRLLATGIKVALNSASKKKDTMWQNDSKESSNGSSLSTRPTKLPVQQLPSTFAPSAWAVDQFLQLSDNEASDKKASPVGFGELDWFMDMGILPDDQVVGVEMLPAGEVPELPAPQANGATFLRPYKSHPVSKKPRVEISDEEDFFVVPDLG